MNVIDLNSVRMPNAKPIPMISSLAQASSRPVPLMTLHRDFPNIVKPGYLTVDEVNLRGRFKTLIDQLKKQLTEEYAKKFGLDLHPYPRLTTIITGNRDERAVAPIAPRRS